MDIKDIKNILKILKEDFQIKKFLNKNKKVCYVINSERLIILFDKEKQILSLSFSVYCNPDKSAKIALKFSEKFKKIIIEDVHIFKENDFLIGNEAVNEAQYELRKKLQKHLLNNQMYNQMINQMINNDNICYHC